MQTAPNYLNPGIPSGLKRVRIPIVEANEQSLSGYGCLVTDPDEVEIEIVRWPSVGKRPVDTDSGDEGGTTEGMFVCEWKGDILYGRNEAVDGHYILGYGTEPEQASEHHSNKPERLLLWHANYHPDGGQLFFPQTSKPFLVPLALPGDDVAPEDFVCFHFTGNEGLYIHPNVWHDGALTALDQHCFFDKQGAVHARVSVDFPREFKCLLEVPLERINRS